MIGWLVGWFSFWFILGQSQFNNYVTNYIGDKNISPQLS